MSTATKTRRSKSTKSPASDDRVTIVQEMTVVRPAPPLRTEMVRLDQIERDGQNHRLEGPENKRKVTELAASFAPGPRAQLEPIRVYERDAGEPGPRYLLGFGFRRCAAAELAGWTEIRAEILPMPGDRSEIERDRAVENLQRHDLNPMEETVAVTNYLDGLPDLVRSAAHGGQLMPSRDASGKPTPAAVEQAAAELGRPTSWIRDRCYLLRLGPKVRKLVINGKLLLGHAREIAKLGDHAVQERLAQMCRVEDDGTCRTTLGQLRRWVGEHERSLKVVPWRLDADFAGAKDKRICGACATCPHNSANDRQLFEHDDAATLVGDGLCLNDACFEAKQAACNRAVEKAVATIVKKELPATEASAERVAAPFVKPGRVAREAKKAKDEGRTPDPAAAELGKQEESAESRDPTPEEQAQADLDTATEKWVEESSDALLEAVKRSPLYLACLILFEKVVRDTWELSEADVTGKHARAFELLARGDESAVRELASLIELGEHNDLDDLGVIADLPESAVDMIVRGWRLPVVKRPTLADFMPTAKAEVTPPTDTGCDGVPVHPSDRRIGGLTWNRDKDSNEWWATNTAGMEGDADVLLDFVVSPPPGNEGGWVIDMSGADLLPVNFPESFETEQKAKAYCEQRNAELAAKGREQMPEANWRPETHVAFAEEPPILDAKDVDVSEREMFAADQLDALARMGEKPKRVKHVLPLLGVGFLGLDTPGRHPSVVLGTTVVRGQECLRLGLLVRFEDWPSGRPAPAAGKVGRDRVVAGKFAGVLVNHGSDRFVIGDVFHVRVGKGGRS